MDNIAATEFIERDIVSEDRKRGFKKYAELPSSFNQSHCKNRFAIRFKLNGQTLIFRSR